MTMGRHVRRPRAGPAAVPGSGSRSASRNGPNASSDQTCPPRPHRDPARDSRRDLRGGPFAGPARYPSARRPRPGALVRDLRKPANAGHLVRSAARHPATRELASAGLLFLPLRYLPVGWAATWVAHRVVRRHLDPPAAVLDASAFGAGRPLKNVTHEAPKV